MKIPVCNRVLKHVKNKNMLNAEKQNPITSSDSLLLADRISEDV